MLCVIIFYNDIFYIPIQEPQHVRFRTYHLGKGLFSSTMLFVQDLKAVCCFASIQAGIRQTVTILKISESRVALIFLQIIFISHNDDMCSQMMEKEN